MRGRTRLLLVEVKGELRSLKINSVKLVTLYLQVESLDSLHTLHVNALYEEEGPIRLDSPALVRPVWDHLLVTDQCEHPCYSQIKGVHIGLSKASIPTLV